MKFVLTKRDTELFQGKTEYDMYGLNQEVKWTERLWDLFWEKVKNTEYPINTDLQYEAEEFYKEIKSPGFADITVTQFLNQMAYMYSEHRTDVTELITSFLDETLPKDWKTWREHRFTLYQIPWSLLKNNDKKYLEIQHDTLTGMLELHVDFPDNDTWEIIDGTSYED